jgi:hypothetical protein
MPDAYYRIAANKSDADATLYQHERLMARLMDLARVRKDRVPLFADIRSSHRFPLKVEYRPTILMSNDLMKITSTPGSRSFRTVYGGDMQGQMFMKLPFSAGNFAANTKHYAFAFCRKFLCSIIKRVTFRTGGELFSEFNGDAFFLYNEWFIQPHLRPALNRMMREAVLEFDFAPSSPVLEANDVPTPGATTVGNGSYAHRVDSLRLFLPHYPVTLPTIHRPAFDIYFPLNIISCAGGLEYSYPLSALHNQDRVLEYEFYDVMDYVNCIVDDTSLGTGDATGVSTLNLGTNAEGAPWYLDVTPAIAQGGPGPAGSVQINAGVGLSSTSGFVLPTDVSTSLFVNKPSLGTIDLYVNYLIVHRDLQKVLSLNGYAMAIRQYTTDTKTVTTNDTWEFQQTKIVEWIGLIGRHSYNYRRTLTGGADITVGDATTYVDAAGATVSAASGTAYHPYHEINPYYMPTDEKPINDIDVLARGQVFYKELDWDMLSSVNPFITAGDDSSTSANNCAGVVLFTQRMARNDVWSTYNSGFGPNVSIRWRTTAFSPSNPGTLSSVMCSVNIFAAYRGVLTVRYA